mmetsp:Transcript_68855/g.224328  ORF Transcript_68855/g.224328 Transcript_68855/m.224328 type:complete len:281 (+) Transcript_68855:349-1191(+)
MCSSCRKRCNHICTRDELTHLARAWALLRTPEGKAEVVVFSRLQVAIVTFGRWWSQRVENDLHRRIAAENVEVDRLEWDDFLHFPLDAIQKLRDAPDAESVGRTRLKLQVGSRLDEGLAVSCPQLAVIAELRIVQARCFFTLRCDDYLVASPQWHHKNGLFVRTRPLARVVADRVVEVVARDPSQCCDSESHQLLSGRIQRHILLQLDSDEKGIVDWLLKLDLQAQLPEPLAPLHVIPIWVLGGFVQSLVECRPVNRHKKTSAVIVLELDRLAIGSQKAS